ncbi:MAG: zinc ribbon domain-containing protein [Sulfurimonas sp.]|uniref:zinc ribbon domain-containing protein n=1 Tax=Sulfurimonas sp. TaxID=2022749 RepID=UPI002601CCC9|nr:zinc ribbon domain-containing protein [Sulfurimonas sp.]MCW8896357.1 zinc ribbon domain-containing protein [Sulfurimonas sp.]MCW8953739.1 zinc ribbon domain-containing protein [Sulfurimonas sp.]MCW9068318.1 zinc ribbon domain-containing protein [Sulfurimonas sp.]
MNLHLKQLIDLSHVDKDIDAFEPQIEEANYKFEAALAKKKSIDSDIENLTNEIKDEIIKKHKNELHLAELSQKLEENSKKSSEVKTEREMKSLQLEEEIAKEQVTFANEEIARLDKIIEHKTEQVEAAKESLVELDSNLESVKAEVDAKLEVINKSRQEVFTKKEKLLSDINQKGLAFYQKIRRWAKNSTVVPVEEQACMGCHMTLSDKIYADVIKAEDITTCPHCGRILYVENTQE